MTAPILDKPPTSPAERAAQRRQKRAAAYAEAASLGWKVWVAKIVMLGIIDALAVYKDADGEIEVEHLSNLSTQEAVELGHLTPQPAASARGRPGPWCPRASARDR